jgi:hypothetical protein
VSVITLFLGLIAVGLAAALLGGGALLTARTAGYDTAQSAARAGAQQIDLPHLRATGLLRLNPARAATAAKQYLTDAGATGQVTVTAARITVTATSRQPTPMLRIVGHDFVDVTATASATPATAPEP